ncbi:enoyl-CoA hydratase/isomerase family protein [Bacillus piscicola]|uniref:enoyl-CoA hydratase/isomerase family protein n=1 Tax=Bacillus piscicola TaxID=1632684 RepID=UPI001F09E502|nr:enoyl-CoA hydratase/isomerase family protein [Bacillus piscicola]
MGKKVIVTREDFFTYVEINQPEKRNAVDYEVMEQLENVLDDVKLKKTDRCLIITGAGNDAFCSGGDLSVFHSLYTKEDAWPMLDRMSKILLQLFSLEIPTIAFINGSAVGGGAEIAAACDYRVAVPEAKIGFVQGKLAITTGWGGTSILLERVSAETAFDMAASCRLYPADKAKEIGFLQHVLNPGQGRAELEQYFAAWQDIPVQVLAAYKRRKLDHTDLNMLRQRMKREVEECAVLWGSDAHHQAVEAFRNKKR